MDDGAESIDLTNARSIFSKSTLVVPEQRTLPCFDTIVSYRYSYQCLDTILSNVSLLCLLGIAQDRMVYIQI